MGKSEEDIFIVLCITDSNAMRLALLLSSSGDMGEGRLSPFLLYFCSEQ